MHRKGGLCTIKLNLLKRASSSRSGWWSGCRDTRTLILSQPKLCFVEYLVSKGLCFDKSVACRSNLGSKSSAYYFLSPKPTYQRQRSFRENFFSSHNNHYVHRRLLSCNTQRFANQFVTPAYTTDMNFVNVSDCDGNQKQMRIVLNFDTKRREFLRFSEETSESTLKRIAKTLSKFFSDNKKDTKSKNNLTDVSKSDIKSKGTNDNRSNGTLRAEIVDCRNSTLDQECSIVAGTTSNIDAWIEGRKLRVLQSVSPGMSINGNARQMDTILYEYYIVRNYPEVVEIEMPKRSIVGVALHATVKMRNIGCTGYVEARWLKRQPEVIANEEATKDEWECVKVSSTKNRGNNYESILHAADISSNLDFCLFSYVPENNDVGSSLKLEVVAKRGEPIRIPTNAYNAEDSNLEFQLTENFSSNVVFTEACHPSVNNCYDIGCLSRLEQYRKDGYENDLVRDEIVDVNRSFEVATYNLLADQYASQEHAKDVMFFYSFYGSVSYLDIEYRKQLIGMELINLEADIICLQEVDVKVYDAYLSSLLAFSVRSRHEIYAQRCGKSTNAPPSYTGHHTPKRKGSKEGCATFVNNERWTVVDWQDVDVAQEICNRFKEILLEIANKENKSEIGVNLVKACSSISTIAQISLLQPTLKKKESNLDSMDDSSTFSEPHLVVVNTHLYFHPSAPHIRLLSVAAIMGAVESFILKYFPNYADMDELVNKPRILFCGDLNSEPDAAVIEYLKNGRVSQTHEDWEYSEKFVFGERYYQDKYDETEDEERTKLAEEEEGSTTKDYNRSVKMDLFGKHSFSLGESSLLVPFSNFAGGNEADRYVALLDYIFVECDKAPSKSMKDNCQDQRSQLMISRALPALSTSLALENSALPSMKFPSDHIPIMVEIASNYQVSNDIQFPIPADKGNIGTAASLLRQNKVIALPTDTLYGFATLASSSSAIESLYRLKGRKRDVPIAIMVSEVHDIACFGFIADIPPGLLNDLFPGRVTILIPTLSEGSRHNSTSRLASNLNPGLKTIGVRVPNNDFCRGVARAVGGAIALTSANLSGHHSTVSVYEFRDLWSECDAVFDGGDLTDGRSGSTIIDLTVKGFYKLIRHGSDAVNLRKILEEKFNMIEKKD